MRFLVRHLRGDQGVVPLPRPVLAAQDGHGSGHELQVTGRHGPVLGGCRSEGLIQDGRRVDFFVQVLVEGTPDNLGHRYALGSGHLIDTAEVGQRRPVCGKEHLVTQRKVSLRVMLLVAGMVFVVGLLVGCFVGVAFQQSQADDPKTFYVPSE